MGDGNIAYALYLLPMSPLQRRKIPMGDGNYYLDFDQKEGELVTAQENPHGGWKLYMVHLGFCTHRMLQRRKIPMGDGNAPG